MTNEPDDFLDPQVTGLFQLVAPDVPDKGFTDRAIRHIGTVIWLRRIASLLAVVVSLPLLVTVLVSLTGTPDGLRAASGELIRLTSLIAQDSWLAVSVLLLTFLLLIDAVRD